MTRQVMSLSRPPRLAVLRRRRTWLLGAALVSGWGAYAGMTNPWPTTASFSLVCLQLAGAGLWTLYALLAWRPLPDERPPVSVVAAPLGILGVGLWSDPDWSSWSWPTLALAAIAVVAHVILRSRTPAAAPSAAGLLRSQATWLLAATALLLAGALVGAWWYADVIGWFVAALQVAMALVCVGTIYSGLWNNLRPMADDWLPQGLIHLTGGSFLYSVTWWERGPDEELCLIALALAFAVMGVGIVLQRRQKAQGRAAAARVRPSRRAGP